MSSTRDAVLRRIREATAAGAAGPGGPADGPMGASTGRAGAPTAHADEGGRDVARTYRVAGEPFADGAAAGAAAGLPELLDLFEDRLVDYHASVVRCPQAGLVGAVLTELHDVASVAVPAGAPAQWIDALWTEGVTVRADADPEPLDHATLDGTAAVLTGCRVGIAQTGTIVLDGGPGQGRRALTLLPDRHVCVVHAEQVVAGVPEAVEVLGEHPTRPLTWISGPSATSDIELVRIEGVHGPRDLRVVLVVP